MGVWLFAAPQGPQGVWLGRMMGNPRAGQRSRDPGPRIFLHQKTKSVVPAATDGTWGPISSCPRNPAPLAPRPPLRHAAPTPCSGKTLSVSRRGGAGAGGRSCSPLMPSPARSKPQQLTPPSWGLGACLARARFLPKFGIVVFGHRTPQMQPHIWHRPTAQSLSGARSARAPWQQDPGRGLYRCLRVWI